MARLGCVLALAMASGCLRALPEAELQARCEQGLAQPCIDLGLARLEQQDVTGAVSWFKRGCGFGVLMACGQLDILHGTAWKSLPALERSLAKVQPACGRGDAMACELERELQGRVATLRDEEARAVEAVAQTLAKAPSEAECAAGSAGGLAREDLRRVIYRHSDDVRACYEEWMWRGRVGTIDVTMAWQIGSEGQVKRATIERDTLPESGVAQCVRGAVLSWRFPPPRCGVTVDVTFPWLLRVKD